MATCRGPSTSRMTRSMAAPTRSCPTRTPIIVYCSNGECQNSTIAADRLSELGYANVFDYVEGKQDWVDAGLPTEQHLPA